MVNADSQQRWMISSVNPPSGRSPKVIFQINLFLILKIQFICNYCDVATEHLEKEIGNKRDFEDAKMKIFQKDPNKTEEEIAKEAKLHPSAFDNPFFGIEGFNPFHNVVWDSLHITLLNQAKQFLECLLSKITTEELNVINQRLKHFSLHLTLSFKKISKEICQKWTGYYLYYFFSFYNKKKKQK